MSTYCRNKVIAPRSVALVEAHTIYIPDIIGRIIRVIIDLAHARCDFRGDTDGFLFGFKIHDPQRWPCHPVRSR